mgnify:CR=1 FL=1
MITYNWNCKTVDAYVEEAGNDPGGLAESTTVSEVIDSTTVRLSKNPTSDGTIQFIKNGTVIDSKVYTGRIMLNGYPYYDRYAGLYRNLVGSVGDIYFDNWNFRIGESNLSSTSTVLNQDNVIFFQKFENNFDEYIEEFAKKEEMTKPDLLKKIGLQKMVHNLNYKVNVKKVDKPKINP